MIVVVVRIKEILVDPLIPRIFNPRRHKIIKQLKAKYPKATIHGHRDLSPDKNKDGKIDKWEFMKQCPCFDAEVEYLEFQPKDFKPRSAAAQEVKSKKAKKKVDGKKSN